MSKIAIHSQVLSSELFDDLIFALYVLQECLVFVLYGQLLFQTLGQFFLDNALLLSHALVDLRDAHGHLSIVLFAESELFFDLESVS